VFVLNAASFLGVLIGMLAMGPEEAVPV